MASPATTHFKTLQKFPTDYSPCVFTQYESERTGMRAVVVDQKGPKVGGYFTLATEITDDSGAPHTLEHLIFMGSKSYKYKGVLDKLATRAYSFTNAWTATDHTAYTLETAGWEGFRQILPIYLEHVLLPTLTDAGCYTEVHHVDGTGHDAGVVYSEMQGVQNNQGSLMDLRAKRLIYPEGNGFRSETGGMMEQLRTLTADRIRSFHREVYQPKNLCLVLIGEINHDELLQTLDEFEDGILDDIPNPGSTFKRPWIDSKPTPPLQGSVVERVEFPEEDESSGEVMVGFLGPDCNDAVLCAALNVLLTYLNGSSVAVLENRLVEIEQVASSVYHSLEFRPDTLIWLGLSSVATEALSDVERRLFEVLKETASKPLDMDYLRDCVRRQKRQVISAVENSASSLADPIISDVLFGKRDGSTLKDFESVREYDVILGWEDQHWRNFLRRWISDAHHVSILGVPSAKLSKQMKEDEKNRVAKQKEELGEEGLKKLEKRLADAKAENEVEIPKSLIEKFKVPGTESIHFIDTTTARGGLARQMGKLENDIQKTIDADTPDLPMFLHFEHIPTNFVHITLVICTESIPVNKRPLLALYLDNFFNTPIIRDGQRIEFEKVVTEIERDTVLYGIDNMTDNPEALRIGIQVEPEKYEVAIKWIKEMLWTSTFDETRLKAAVTKILANIPEEKRSGSRMVAAARTMIHNDQQSTVRSCNTLVKALYCKRIKRVLQEDPKTVLAQMEEVRNALCQLNNFRVLVVANLQKLERPVTTWKLLLDDRDASAPLNPLDSRYARLSPLGRNPKELAYIVPMSTVDSSFSHHTARGVNSFDHPQLPALRVALSYLDATEGPMWTAVRGNGLAYGTGFSFTVDTGLIVFQVYRSPNAYKAFTAGKQVVESYISGATEFDTSALEGAISSIVVSIADDQPSMVAAAHSSFINQVIRGVPADYDAQLLKKVREVTVPQIKQVLESIVLPIFKPETADAVVTCAPLLEESIRTGFADEGFKVEVQPLSFFQDDYGLKAKDGEEDDEEEELEAGEDEDEEEGEDSEAHDEL
ncbi:MAG: hypothetical protein M1833_005863 [Piccolia ochrophora]|nr:MAG: hypothetical protein M1833_005863 [Piccolia ochrophora]